MEQFKVENYLFNKNYVIEASAGTGKTYNVISIVKKLMMDYDVDLEKILIVTYTEKAAGELKNRIRECINEDESGKLKKYNPDSASIFTIHSFCQSIIKEFGVSSSIPSNLNLIDESELDDYIEVSLRQSPLIDELNKCSLYFNYDKDFFSSLSDKLKALIKKYYLDEKFKEDVTLISYKVNEKINDNFDLFYKLMSSETYLEFASICPDFKDNIDKLAGQNKKATKLSVAALNIIKDFKILRNESFRKYFVKDAKTTNKKLKEIKDYIDNILTGKNNFINYLAQKYFKDIYIGWKKQKEKNKQETFEDMIDFTRSCIISNQTFKEKVRNKYQYGIIDEFQDTNQKQYDIFKNVFLMDDKHHLIVVGDPKQSIYGFQNADINVYFKAIKEIEENNGIKQCLNKNYRSTPEMVKTCNALFSYYNFDKASFTPSNYASLEDNDSFELEAKYKNEPCKAFWVATNASNGAIENEKSESTFAKIAVKAIIDCCSKDENGKTNLQIKTKNGEFRNVTFSDFIILVRKRSDKTPLENILKKVGIPVLNYKDASLFTSRECKHFVVLLDAINTRDFTSRNRKKLYKALFTSFFGLSLFEINKEKYKHDDIEEVELISSWKDLKSKEKWEDLFDSVIVDSRLIDNLKSLSHIQSLSIFKQLSSFCVSYLSNNNSFDSLIKKLRKLSSGVDDNDEDEENSQIVERSTNFDSVKIMTMHASKGLQFPVVIPYSGYQLKKKAKKDVPILEKEENGNKVISLYEGNVTNEISIKELNELTRLFYVAFTRAEDLCIVPFFKGECFNNVLIGKLIKEHQNLIRIIKDNNFDKNELKEKVKTILSSLKVETEGEKEYFEQVEILKKICKEVNQKTCFKHSYSSLSHNNEGIDENENKEGNDIIGLANYDKEGICINGIYDDLSLPLKIPEGYPKGALIGTALHEIFEYLTFNNYDSNLNHIIDKVMNEQNITLNEEMKQYTSDIVNHVMNAKLPVIHGNKFMNCFLQLYSITNENKKSEIEFNMNLNNEKLHNYCNGFIDLLFKNGEYYSILDWKSDTLNDEFISYNNVIDLKEHVDTCYSIQRTLYSYTLIKWLKNIYKDKSEEEIFNQHFGGIYYVFVRGCQKGITNGVYSHTWSSYLDLEKAFNEIIKDKIGR